MKWEPFTSWCVVSDCGNYTVTRAQLDTGYGYTAWYRKTLLGSYLSTAAARAVCRQHQENNSESPDT